KGANLAPDGKTTILLNSWKPLPSLLNARIWRQPVGGYEETNQSLSDGTRGRGNALALPRRCQRAILRRRPVELSRRHLFRPKDRPVQAAVPAGQRALERRGRSIRPSVDDGVRDPRGRGQFRSLRGRHVG